MPPATSQAERSGGDRSCHHCRHWIRRVSVAGRIVVAISRVRSAVARRSPSAPRSRPIPVAAIRVEGVSSATDRALQLEDHVSVGVVQRADGAAGNGRYRRRGARQQRQQVVAGGSPARWRSSPWRRAMAEAGVPISARLHPMRPAPASTSPGPARAVATATKATRLRLRARKSPALRRRSTAPAGTGARCPFEARCWPCRTSPPEGRSRSRTPPACAPDQCHGVPAVNSTPVCVRARSSSACPTPATSTRTRRGRRPLPASASASSSGRAAACDGPTAMLDPLSVRTKPARSSDSNTSTSRPQEDCEVTFQQDALPADGAALRRRLKRAHPCRADDRHTQRAVRRLPPRCDVTVLGCAGELLFEREAGRGLHPRERKRRQLDGGKTAVSRGDHRLPVVGGRPARDRRVATANQAIRVVEQRPLRLTRRIGWEFEIDAQCGHGGSGHSDGPRGCDTSLRWVRTAVIVREPRSRSRG